MKHDLSRGLRRSRGGFSLLEILAVLVIIGIIAAIAIPMWKGPSKGLQLRSAADLLKGELLLARQEAMTLNGQMEFRFFQETASAPFTAYQVFNIAEDGSKTPHSKLRLLPEGLVLPADADLSPLLADSLLKGTQADGVPAVKGWSYAAVSIRPSGEFSDVNPARAFVTLIESAAPKVSGNLPANYAVIQVQPLTGVVSVTQP